MTYASSLLFPKGLEIVSARGPESSVVTYKIRVDLILDPNTNLVVLINDGTDSSEEIILGAV